MKIATSRVRRDSYNDVGDRGRYEGVSRSRARLTESATMRPSVVLWDESDIRLPTVEETTVLPHGIVSVTLHPPKTG